MVKYSRRAVEFSGLRDIVVRRVPIVTLDSGKPGPTVCVTGCIHGNEPGGIAIVHELVKSVRKLGMKKGKIVALPLINSVGFEHGSRYINTEREDLNRCFPGDPKGTLGQRFANRLFLGIRKQKPDLVIDLHNDWVQSVPYVVLEAPGVFRNAAVRRKAIAAAAATGLLTVQESDDAEAMASTLTGALSTAGVPAFVIEAGAAGAIVEKSVFAGRDAVLGAIASLGLLDGVPQTTKHPAAAQVLDYTSSPFCMSNGVIRFLISPGDRIRPKQPLARIYSAFGSTEETLHATCSGFVLGVTDVARATPGSEVVAIAKTVS
jgi:predicted deacylase